ncbi:MAG: macro domain-containing protein [Candidatus Micrarchaeota archaeon]
MNEVEYRGVFVRVRRGDLTKTRADALVNPANSLGVMGGGVAAALKAAGGERVEKDAMACAPIAVGNAVGVSAGALPARYVIHAPTMVRPAERIHAKAVDMATHAALREATRLNCQSIAFPGMGTGVGGVKAVDAAHAMVGAIKFFLGKEKTSLKEILLIGFDEELERAFDQAIGSLSK